ncbi:hypothetical protein ES705_31542 [subsurface metagenome]
MAELVTTAITSLSPEETIERAVMFFPGEKWRARTHSAKVATFEGKPPIPWGTIFLMIIGFLFFIVPGLIFYFIVIRKTYRLQNIVVSASLDSKGTEVIIRYPKQAKKLAKNFLSALPDVESAILVK